MKRKIIFRAKSKSTNTWLYGDLLRNEQGAFAVVPPFKMNMSNECNLYEVDEETVGQFTGLTDDKGNGVYEGDICKITETTLNGMHTFNVIVKWNDGAMAFVAYKAEDAQVPMSWFKNLTDGEVEVIGTIYDNANLLEE